MLDLFCGIGGASLAAADVAQVVVSVDINELAVGVLRQNQPHLAVVRELDSLPDDWFRQWNADLWWLSPPCQPFTQRGQQRDIKDQRAQPLLGLLDRIKRLQPRMLGLENVPGFHSSQAHQRLCNTLVELGYEIAELLLCPTQLGIPNRRRRFYLVASLDGLAPWPSLSTPCRLAPLAGFLQSDPRKLDEARCKHELYLAPELVAQYQRAIHIVDLRDPAATTRCFTAAYGRSHVGSGSYLQTAQGVRRFLPGEILRLLGFPDGYLPCELAMRNAWRLVGNSLSLPAVRYVLQAVLPGADEMIET